MIGDRFGREVGKMLSDGVDSTAAVCSTQVESVAEAMMRCPPCPTSLIAMSGPDEYAVHVEQ